VYKIYFAGVYVEVIGSCKNSDRLKEWDLLNLLSIWYSAVEFELNC
jgi:hypothetical protein